MVKLKISNFKFALIFLVYFISLQVIELNHTFFDVFKFFFSSKKEIVNYSTKIKIKFILVFLD